MNAKRQECQAKKKWLQQSLGRNRQSNTRQKTLQIPLLAELKEIFEFTNLSMHRRDGDDVSDFGFCQVGTHTDKVPIRKPTTSGVDEKNDATMSVVDDNRMNTVMTFADIVHGNQSPKSVTRVNPIIPDQKKQVLQNKKVVRFTLV